MAYCKKSSHHYDSDSHQSCPWCADEAAKQGGGGGAAAPDTKYEEGPAPGGQQPNYQGNALRPIPPMPNNFLGGGGASGPAPVQPMGGGGIAAGGPKTTYLEATEATERLMGFLVITHTKEDQEHRYFRLSKGINFIGRLGSRCTIELRDPEISDQHVLLVCTNSSTRAIDLDSRNGMMIDGDKFEIAELAEGDTLKLGRTHLQYVPFPWMAEY